MTTSLLDGWSIRGPTIRWVVVQGPFIPFAAYERVHPMFRLFVEATLAEHDTKDTLGYYYQELDALHLSVTTADGRPIPTASVYVEAGARNCEVERMAYPRAYAKRQPLHRMPDRARNSCADGTDTPFVYPDAIDRFAQTYVGGYSTRAGLVRVDGGAARARYCHPLHTDPQR